MKQESNETSNMKLKAIGVTALLLAATFLSSCEPEEVIIPVVHTVIDTVYIENPNGNSGLLIILNFIQMNFGVGENTSSYEYEWYKANLYRKEATINFTLEGTEGAPLEFIFYNGHIPVFTATSRVDNILDKELKISVPEGFNSIRLKVSNQTLEPVSVNVNWLKIN